MTAPAILPGGADLLIENPNRSLSAALYDAGLALEQAARKGLPAPLGVAVVGEDVHVRLEFLDVLEWQEFLDRPRVHTFPGMAYLRISGDFEGRKWYLEAMR